MGGSSLFLSCRRGSADEMRKVVGKTIDWADAHAKASKRMKYLFKVKWDAAGRGHIPDSERASCCASIRKPSVTWPLTQVKHLGSLRHFKTWCAEHPLLVRERFPEAVDLVAEDFLAGSAGES